MSLGEADGWAGPVFLLEGNKFLLELDVSFNRMNLPETEKKLIMKALNETDWNQTRAAHVPGITRKQLRTKMQRHNLLPG